MVGYMTGVRLEWGETNAVTLSAELLDSLWSGAGTRYEESFFTTAIAHATQLQLSGQGQEFKLRVHFTNDAELVGDVVGPAQGLCVERCRAIALSGVDGTGKTLVMDDEHMVVVNETGQDCLLLACNQIPPLNSALQSPLGLNPQSPDPWLGRESPSPPLLPDSFPNDEDEDETRMSPFNSQPPTPPLIFHFDNI